MSELLRIAFEEAARHAAGLPGEPVAVVSFIFAADHTCAPILSCEPDAIPLVTARLMDVADALLLAMPLPADQAEPGEWQAGARAEEIAAGAIARARRA